jgi:hypothetical protein
MPRSVKTSRIIAEATLTTGDLPASAGDAVCFSVTVPTRGFIHRVPAPPARRPLARHRPRQSSLKRRWTPNIARHVDRT